MYHTPSVNKILGPSLFLVFLVPLYIPVPLLSRDCGRVFQQVPVMSLTAACVSLTAACVSCVPDCSLSVELYMAPGGPALSLGATP